MQFSVRFYYDADGNKPVLAFLENLRKQDRILYKLVVAGIKKLETSERHGPPLTQLVDQKYDIFELRIGDKNIARVFFFFRQSREIILTSGYVKKQQKVDTGELERARSHKKDWEQRHT
jgi:phage-related protein